MCEVCWSKERRFWRLTNRKCSCKVMGGRGLAVSGTVGQGDKGQGDGEQGAGDKRTELTELTIPANICSL